MYLFETSLIKKILTIYNLLNDIFILHKHLDNTCMIKCRIL